MSLKVHYVFRGLPDLRKELRLAGERAEVAGRAGIYAVAVAIMRDAKRRTPVDTGALRASGFVTVPTRATPNIQIGFGGPAKAYAAIQHEVSWYRHRVGESHFLLNAINAVSGGSGTALLIRTAKAMFTKRNGAIAKAADIPTSPWG